MKTNVMMVCMLAAALAAPVLSSAGAPEADSSHPVQYVKDSAITAAVKTKLAGDDHVGSLTQLTVDTDQDGIVWLRGSASTQEAADRAVEAARNADGVVAVKSNIVVARGTK